jgi:hypothetical protein
MPGVTNYLIYRNGSLIDTMGNTTNYTVYGRPLYSVCYSYHRDAAGNISACSNTIQQQLNFDVTATNSFKYGLSVI